VTECQINVPKLIGDQDLDAPLLSILEKFVAIDYWATSAHKSFHELNRLDFKPDRQRRQVQSRCLI
jgi:hypothetical protein